MDYVWYLFHFEGRINRAKCWMAVPIIIAIGLCWLIVFGLPAMSAAKFLGHAGSKHFSLGVDEILRLFGPAFYRSLTLAQLPIVFAETAGSVLILWICSAVSIKRLHDRDKGAWWMVPFFVLPGQYNQITDWLPDVFVLQLALAIGSFVLCVWGMIELYFLKGSRKTNRFGADPLAPVDTRPPWDQQSEIEMVPRKAGPPPVWRVKPGYE